MIKPDSNTYLIWKLILRTGFFPKFKAGTSFNPRAPRRKCPWGTYSTYVEELKDVSNAEIGGKDVFKLSVSIQK